MWSSDLGGFRPKKSRQFVYYTPQFLALSSMQIVQPNTLMVLAGIFGLGALFLFAFAVGFLIAF